MEKTSLTKHRYSVTFRFWQSWKIQNHGLESWPEGCFLKVVALNGENVDTGPYISHLQQAENNNNVVDEFHRINLIESAAVTVPALRPGMEAICRVQLLSPAQYGTFHVKCRLCTRNGNFFGDILWAYVQVSDSGTLALTQQMNSLHASATTTTTTMPIVLHSSNNNNDNNNNNNSMQLVEANSEFLFNRFPQQQQQEQGPPVESPNLSGSSDMAAGSGSGGGVTGGPQAMDAVDLLPKYLP